MVFSITPIYALPLAVIYLALWFRVSAVRGASGISFGDGGNVELLRRIRQHGNCSEWLAFVLILMMLAEGMGSAPVWLHGAGALLLIGRIAHPFGLSGDRADHPMRYLGNGSNILAAVIAMICIGLQLSGL